MCINACNGGVTKVATYVGGQILRHGESCRVCCSALHKQQCCSSNYTAVFSGLCRIEHLDKWCRDLKILYLQGNLISRIG